MGLVSVDADGRRTRDVIDRINDSLSGTAIVADTDSSLLAREKGFEKRTAFCRLLLNLGDGGRWRGFSGRFVGLQAGSKMLQLAVLYRYGIDVPDWSFFQRSL